MSPLPFDSAPVSSAPTAPPGRVEAWLLRFGTMGELLVMLWSGQRWWMLPLAVVLLVLGIVLVGLQSVQYVAPFIYLMF